MVHVLGKSITIKLEKEGAVQDCLENLVAS
jgi:hypothetical protein